MIVSNDMTKFQKQIEISIKAETTCLDPYTLIAHGQYYRRRLRKRPVLSYSILLIQQLCYVAVARHFAHIALYGCERIFGGKAIAFCLPEVSCG